jgi:hypothetical protein
VADYYVRSEGSLFLFEPLNDAARENLEQNVGDEAQWWAGALVVEHRYANELWDRLTIEGWVVEG